MKMRVTTHNGRAGKDGAYSVKHNDRKFDTENSEHIDSSLTSQNHEWKFDTETIGESSSFEEHEQKFYEYYFSSALEQRNDRARQSRHMERVQTMEQYRKNKRACPEETILQIGCAGNTVDASVLKAVCEEYMQWHMKTYPNVKLLDAALHVDEPNAAPHLHLRRVWTVADSEGNLSVSQSKALEQLGIERPNPQKKRDRYNNPKVVFTQQCRDKFIEICERYGIAVEHTPLEPSKSGLSHDEYIRQQEQAKTEQARAELAKLQEKTKPFMEMEITTQSVTDNAKVKTGLFSGKTTVTLPQEDFDILLQQAKAYILNRDDVENLRAEQEKLQQEKEQLHQMQANFNEQQLQFNIEIEDTRRKLKSELELSRRGAEAYYFKKMNEADKCMRENEKIKRDLDIKRQRATDAYNRQQNLNQILKQTEEKLDKTQKENANLSYEIKKLNGKLTTLEQTHQREIEQVQQSAHVTMLESLQTSEEKHRQIIIEKESQLQDLQEKVQELQCCMEQSISEKEHDIQKLQSRLNGANAMATRYIHVMAIMRQFANMHPNLTDEQKIFLKAIQEYSLEKFAEKRVETIRSDIEKFGQSKKMPEDFQKLMDNLTKELEQQEEEQHISYGGMRRR